MTKKTIRRRIIHKNLSDLILPSIIIAIICLMLYFLPFTEVLKPTAITELSDINDAYADGAHYVNISVDTLYSTGYECSRNGRTAGKYYYTIQDNRCYFFLISQKHLNTLKRQQQSLEVLYDVNVTAGLQSGGKPQAAIMESLAKELGWTYSGLIGISSRLLINEADYHYYKSLAILYVIIFILAAACLIILRSLLAIAFPALYAPMFRLRRYGGIKAQLELAEQEMSTKLTLRQNDFLITESFLIDLSNHDVQLIPLDKIVWAYKFSSYHPFRYKHRRITYTLCLYCKQKVLFKSPYQLKINADSVLDYLNAYYPDVLIGYSKEYEKTARQRAGK